MIFVTSKMFALSQTLVRCSCLSTPNILVFLPWLVRSITRVVSVIGRVNTGKWF